jgi:hypothetical protein
LVWIYIQGISASLNTKVVACATVFSQERLGLHAKRHEIIGLASGADPL